ncbi:MAG: SGNH/GDSL hydrolase family protein [Proteobacteria bacterium]|uniref:SGNH/GDSL hydrolase family protein n=1 Tax=Rudaea sp. TaxID=2136325 RepID=UPI00321F943E|nr:SGNH/GDSL hydrolase family protein [Pseudomonadota bacterium]
MNASPRFLALGDSYTIGEGVAEAERWPVQLAQALGIAAPDILARTGWTTDELAAAMAQHAFDPPYDLVTLLIGVNNQYRGRDLANYRDEFRALLERAIELAGGRPGRVIVVSIPDWGVTRFGRESGRDAAQTAREIDRYNTANAEISRSARVHHVDVTAFSREDPGLVVADGLHPSGTAYRRWSEAILPVARRALETR